MNPTVEAVTRQVVDRSRGARQLYLDRLARARDQGPRRDRLSCGNLAHAVAGCSAEDKAVLVSGQGPNIAIVTAYNDMLSAHRPYETYPAELKRALSTAGARGQVAGGVPAMCDGVTQGRIGMEMSLFSREVIALATAVALSHDVFDGALLLGICDKIVPGLLIGALSFGHLPAILVPAGPMPSGLSNEEKSRVRKLAAEGKADRAALLDAEMKAYHAPGTCTFYGTANSNQMLVEIMGLHLPGASFVNPATPERHAFTAAAAERIAAITALGTDYRPIGEIVDERALINGIVGLLATGGSTNHTLHLIAIARAAGITLTWDDFAALSDVVPLLARIYPNGSADVNAFQAAGGMGFLIDQLLSGGFLHDDVRTVAGDGLACYAKAHTSARNDEVLRPVGKPFSPDGGLKLLSGNLGRAVIKTSAVKPEHRIIEAPARLFADQAAVTAAFKAGELNRDVVVVVRFQGPAANGMPELHQLTPALSVLLDRGFKVAIVTDGRMSGASGRVPAAIHVTPEAAAGGPLARLRDGDRVRLDSVAGELVALVDAADFAARAPVVPDLSGNTHGLGRELFAPFRAAVGAADLGAGIFPALGSRPHE